MQKMRFACKVDKKMLHVLLFTYKKKNYFKSCVNSKTNIRFKNWYLRAESIFINPAPAYITQGFFYKTIKPAETK